MAPLKWQRVRIPGSEVIGGYRSGRFFIRKNVSIDEASCVVSEQGSEKATDWTLFKDDNEIGTFHTLVEAKEAAKLEMKLSTS